MAKPFVTLGSFAPFGQQFLSESERGEYQLLPVEHDGILGEEEIYLSKDGGCIWSSGRQMVRGFQSVSNLGNSKVPSKILQAVRCTFSQVEHHNEGPRDACDGPRGFAGESWALLCSSALLVKSDAEDFLARLEPLKAKRVWALADGVLILVADSQGNEHAVTLVGHPFNLPRCISYVEAQAAESRVKKDHLHEAGDFQLRWVSQELPVALAYSSESRRHSVFLIRRRRLEAVEGLGDGGPSESALIQEAPSEVFLQRLHTIPEEGPSCELDDASLLAPDCHFPSSGSSARSPCKGGALLMAIFIRSTRRLLVLRLWTGEVLATLDASSWVPLLPGHDLRSRRSGTFAFAPSRWIGASGHSRLVLAEHGLPVPNVDGLPPDWADEVLDPLELTRCSAVLSFDRHRLPQYFLRLNEASQLILHWGASQLFEVSAGSHRPAWIGDAVANRFTLRTKDGDTVRCLAPLEAHSPRLSGVLSAISFFCPKALAETLMSDVQVWCIADGSSGRENEDEDEEWWRFCELFFCLLEQALAEVAPGNSPPYKRLRKTPCDEEMGSDWDWLLGSDVHGHERHRFRYSGLKASQEFKPHPEHRTGAEPEAGSSERTSELWQSELLTKTELFRQHLEDLFLSFHLLYEEWKLHSLQARLLPSMACFLHATAKRLKLPAFETHYAKDFPNVTAATRLGSYGAQNAAGDVPLLDNLRKAPVPNLLASIRRRADGNYPEVFPLSSLLLSLHRLLKRQPGQRSARSARPEALLVELHGVKATLLDPPAALLPFYRAGQALPGAERARFVRRWLLERAGRPETPPWEAALVLLVQHQVAPSEVELWTLALALPVQECLRAAAEEPRNDWLVEAYTLIGREDLALMARAPREVSGHAAASRRRARDLLDATEVRPGTVDPLSSSEWLNRMFDKDRRAQEVARLLSSSRPVTLRVPRRPEQTDLDFEHSKQTRLAEAALRQSALCVGRGAFTLGAVFPLPTELLPIPAFVLSGRFPPQAGVQSLDPSHHKQELNVWAEFNNGVAAALQVATSTEVSRGWIAHHRSASSNPASADGQVSSNAHAGFLLGLGLRGCLKVLPVADCYKYLRLQHETTSAAVILGLAASNLSSMDAALTRTCCVHIPSMLPATFSDVEVSSPVQCSAVLSLGLLYAGSGHRMMTELMVAEIGRKPSDRVLHDRESYSLAAGFALGCICLGQGSDAPGLADLQLDTWLLRYILGGPEMPLPGVATREAQRQESTCQLWEPEGINTCVTAPAGCIALALVFLRTNCEAVASRVAIPQNLFHLEQLRPDFALLRIVAKSLILWDQIEPTNEWVDRQTPAFLSKLPTSGADIDWLLVTQTKANLAAGACLALGLRFAGSSNEAVKDLLIARLLGFRDAARSDAHVALMASKPSPDDVDAITLETCQSTVALALGMVMAGTGDLAALRTLRSLRKKTSLDTGYGVHMATHMAIGWVCLGGGRYTFDQEPLSIAALLMASFPRFPVGLVDNRCHLQAFRHLYALAARHRCIEAVEVGSKEPVHVHVALQTRKDDGQLEAPETLLFPRLLLASSKVASIRVNSEGFWPVTIKRAEPGTAAARWMKAVEDTRRLYVKRAAPGAGQSQLGLGGSQVWFPTFTAPDDSQVERLAMPKLPSGGPSEGPLPPSASQATAAEWAAAFCCETRPPLLPGACLADFDQHGTLVERFAQLLEIGENNDPKKPVRSQLPFNAVLAQKLYECVAESKLAVFPWIVFLCLQMKTFMQDKLASLPTLGVEHLLAALSFQELRAGIGARHQPLLSQDFLAECKAHAKQRRNAEVQRAANRQAQ